MMKIGKQAKVFQNIVFAIGVGIFASANFDVAVAMNKKNDRAGDYISWQQRRGKGSKSIIKGPIEFKQKKEDSLRNPKKPMFQSSGLKREEDILSPPPNSTHKNSQSSHLSDCEKVSDALKELKDCISIFEEQKKRIQKIPCPQTGHPSASKKTSGLIGATREVIEKRSEETKIQEAINGLKAVTNGLESTKNGLESTWDKMHSLFDNIARLEKKLEERLQRLDQINKNLDPKLKRLNNLQENSMLIEAEKETTKEENEEKLCNLSNEFNILKEEFNDLKKWVEKIVDNEIKDVEEQELDLKKMEILSKENARLKKENQKLETQNIEYEDRLKKLEEKLENQQTLYEKRFGNLEEQINDKGSVSLATLETLISDAINIKLSKGKKKKDLNESIDEGKSFGVSEFSMIDESLSSLINKLNQWKGYIENCLSILNGNLDLVLQWINSQSVIE